MGHRGWALSKSAVEGRGGKAKAKNPPYTQRSRDGG